MAEHTDTPRGPARRAILDHVMVTRAGRRCGRLLLLAKRTRTPGDARRPVDVPEVMGLELRPGDIPVLALHVQPSRDELRLQLRGLKQHVRMDVLEHHDGECGGKAVSGRISCCSPSRCPLLTSPAAWVRRPGSRSVAGARTWRCPAVQGGVVRVVAVEVVLLAGGHVDFVPRPCVTGGALRGEPDAVERCADLVRVGLRRPG
ncbi:hypothetical protein [Streptomyces kanamyceticus]|uniref:hypothetical protein n=1 Tax=Streptomyces kanamyceticus TaxID=1967 RepID=UPI0037DC8AAB